MSGEGEDGEAHEEEGGAKQEQQIESPVASSNTVPGPRKINITKKIKVKYKEENHREI